MSYPNTPYPIVDPVLSEELAEFMGIMMGDGGMSQYQAAITLHSTDDKDYSVFVIRMIERLFEYSPSVHFRKNASALSIVMSRIQLVRYLHSLGLPIGDKIRNGISIPLWIQKRADFPQAFVRGLVDTDGSVFTHRYHSKGRWYAYKKLSFTSVSAPLLESVHSVLAAHGMHPRLGSNFDIRLDSKADMECYFANIGTHNPKHLRRYRS